jgi:hypothetical protein
MQLEILCCNHVLRRFIHNDQIYVEAPSEGDYTLRLTNNSPNQRLAVVSIDGINVISGKDAGYDGAGFVLRPWESLPIQGWLRSNEKAAAFTFKPNDASYAAGTGRGTKNTGVVGVAVFDEKPVPFAFRPKTTLRRRTIIEEDVDPFGSLIERMFRPAGGQVQPWNDQSGQAFYGIPSTLSSTFSSTNDGQQTKGIRSASLKGAPASAGIGGTLTESLGTGYGQEIAQHTRSVTFERATAYPILVLQVRYATTETLRAWGVPVDATPVAAPTPNAFPAAAGFAQPPASWTGR